MNGFYQSAGVRLGYRDTGAGLPVVFLHPTPLDRDYWRPVVEQLGGVRAIVPDLRGHGLSELGTSLPKGGFLRVPDAPVLTMARMAVDIVVLLDSLEIKEAVFVGCSIGGYVLLELWRIAQERVRGLGFVCSKAQPDTEAGIERRRQNIERLRAEGTAGVYDGMAKALTGATAQASFPGLAGELRNRMTLSVEAAVAVQAGLATRPDSQPTLHGIVRPVLAIAGGEDAGCTPAEMEAFRVVPGGCEYHLLPDAGHFAAYEQPDKIAAVLAEWLRQLEN